MSFEECLHLMPEFLCRACHPELNRPSMFTGRTPSLRPALSQPPRREPTATFLAIPRYRPGIERYKPKE